MAYVREKDQELYAEIIRRYQVKLAHYLRKFIRDVDELEDVLQGVFIKAFRNLYSFNLNRKFSPWLYRIAHNEALNHLRKYKKEAVSLDQTEWEIIDQAIDIKEKIFARPIVTEIKSLAVFYEAEEEHKNYYAKNPEQAYCQLIISPKLIKLRQKFSKLLK